MSAEEPTEQDGPSEVSITFEQFSAFYKDNTGLDNSEYYKQFPNVNQGTIRSWKAKAKKQIAEESTSQQSTPQDNDRSLDRHIDNLLEAINKIPGQHFDESLLEGLDNNSQYRLLENYQKRLEENQSTANHPVVPDNILGSQENWIDDFSTIDGVNHKISIRIPASEMVKKANEKLMKKTNKRMILWND